MCFCRGDDPAVVEVKDGCRVAVSRATVGGDEENDASADSASSISHDSIFRERLLLGEAGSLERRIWTAEHEGVFSRVGVVLTR